MKDSAEPAAGDDWRRKYEELRRQAVSRERAHADAQTLTLKATLRLALACRGISPELDKELHSLRATLRDADEDRRRDALLAFIDRGVALLGARPAVSGPSSDAAYSSTAPGPAEALLALLDTFDVPDSHGFEFNQLKSRLVADGPNERTLAGVRDFLIDLLSTEDTQTVCETLVDLLDWLLLPDDFEARMETLKTGLEGRTLKHPVRDTAGFVNDLQAFLRHDVRELAEYLKRVSQQLHEVEGELAGALGENRVSVENSGTLLEEISAEIGELEAAATPGASFDDLKLAVDERVGRVRAVLGSFIVQQEQRHATYARQIEFLTRELRAFEHEADTIRQSLEAEHRKAYRDMLTGVPNRLALEERLRLEFEKVRRYNHGLVIAVIDIDHFKRVNDNYGHKAGDKVLSYIASICHERLRASDFFARYGGEEFVALFPETSMENACALCEQLREKVEDTNVGYRGKRVPVTISIGLYKVDRNDTPDLAFERADRALYKAKQTGRNRIIVA